jgi:hypothetical protein
LLVFKSVTFWNDEMGTGKDSLSADQ